MRRGWGRFLVAAGVIAAAWMAWDRWQPTGAEAGTAAVAAGTLAAPGQAAAVAAGAAAPAARPALATREQELKVWRLRYEQAERIYQEYREATRLPPHSRPLANRPDQARPFDPSVDEGALRDAAGRPVAGVRIRSTQDRVFVNGPESARFTLEAVDAQGQRVPLVVLRAAAQNLPESRALTTLVRSDVAFTDDGAGADDIPRDGRYAAVLTPASQGFATHAGTIRVVAEVTANGEQGSVAFDIVYVPEVAGSWGGVREALEDGNLNFYLQAQVAAAGRYVVSARVLDAQGLPVALLQFNDLLPAGAVEVKLSLAGLLVHDTQPAFPLKLVNVDGFLLKPDTYPDRVMLPRRPGVVHLSRTYATDRFSAEEWRSPERDRYMAEYLRDIQRAEDAIARLRP